MGEKWEAHVPNIWDDSALAGNPSETHEEHENIGGNEAVLDKRVLCPTTGEVCAAMASLVTNYEFNVKCSARLGDLPAEMSPHLDGIKLQARLAEYRARARQIGCEGMTEDTCPVRASMDEAPVRSSVVQIFRGIFRRNVAEG